MKMKHAALAIALAFGAAGLAQAEVTISGKADFGVQARDTGDSTQGAVKYQGEIDFSGRDKLDNGMNFIWTLNQEINNINAGSSYTANSQWGNRDAYGGLEGDFGTVRVGKFRSGVYALTDDLYGDTGADWFFSDYGRGMTQRPDNIVGYTSPVFGGFQFSADYILENQSTGKSSSNGYDVAGTYTNGGLKVLGGYQARQGFDGTKDATAGASFQQPDGSYSYGDSLNGGSDDTDSQTAYVGLQYKFQNGFGVTGGYKYMEFTPNSTGATYGGTALDAGTDYHQNMYNLMLSYNQGRHDVYAAYTYLDDLKGGSAPSDSGAQAFSLRYNYHMSKNTFAYAEYRYVKNDQNSSYSADDDLYNYSATSAGEDTQRGIVGVRTYF
ncbi:porin [Jeongeupia chitinilytica]|uniref:Porin n=1 Tax=Jeongeupia chitinilytica TaxID=1041641 RepID=A0ABQ3H5S7_9NEIS|nr:porin [Jeongeupia chitinilytica]GHD68513.1 porin [Jeongeupia chitinilytica]